jgi:DNA polymerase-3 subunit delta'
MAEVKDIPDWIFEQSIQALETGRTHHHALLIVGRRGDGQRELAQLLAAAQLCEANDRVTPAACGRCPACHWLGEGHHLDFRWIRPEAEQPAPAEGTSRSTRAAKPSRDIVIDQIRELTHFVEHSSHRGARRVVLIDPADAMNSSAANAILKTLEEPPPGVMFLLTSERPDRLPATVRSRCSVLPVQAPDRDRARAWLAARAGVSEAQAEATLAAVGGGAIAALHSLRHAEHELRERITATLGALPESVPIEAADALSSIEPLEILRMLHAWILDLGRVSVGAVPLRFAVQEERLRVLAARVDLTRLLAFEQSLLEQLRWAHHPLNPRLVLEDLMLRYRALFRSQRGHPAGAKGPHRTIGRC